MEAYLTESEAIKDLKSKGYDIDFNLGFNGIHTYQEPDFLSPDKFRIVEVYRFEGNSNPDDESILYVIESTDGRKGTLINGYGISADLISDEMIKKLSIRK